MGIPKDTRGRKPIYRLPDLDVGDGTLCENESQYMAYLRESKRAGFEIVRRKIDGKIWVYRVK